MQTGCKRRVGILILPGTEYSASSSDLVNLILSAFMEEGLKEDLAGRLGRRAAEPKSKERGQQETPSRATILQDSEAEVAGKDDEGDLVPLVHDCARRFSPSELSKIYRS
ncbi:biosynthetic arginine decarboxylase [Striga asiatica]|uniref:Biosynthetic arginine decarboxylase n=1 Tax=Striga asiatica TaxID=4170 RepID=A0A5A7RGM7_STRAF|nr:biosynthetic arginine decarboxylase [Striga asiatica]